MKIAKNSHKIFPKYQNYFNNIHQKFVELQTKQLIISSFVLFLEKELN